MFQESVRSSTKSSSMKLKIIPKVKKDREKLHKQKSNSSLSGRRSTGRSPGGGAPFHVLISPSGTWDIKSGPGEADLGN